MFLKRNFRYFGRWRFYISFEWYVFCFCFCFVIGIDKIVFDGINMFDWFIYFMFYGFFFFFNKYEFFVLKLVYISILIEL